MCVCVHLDVSCYIGNSDKTRYIVKPTSISWVIISWGPIPNKTSHDSLRRKGQGGPHNSPGGKVVWRSCKQVILTHQDQTSIFGSNLDMQTGTSSMSPFFKICCCGKIPTPHGWFWVPFFAHPCPSFKAQGSSKVCVDNAKDRPQ